MSFHFFNLYKLFPDFICTNNIGSQVKKIFGVKNCKPVLVIFLFRGFGFTLSELVFSGSNVTSSSASSSGIGSKSSSPKKELSLQNF